MGTWSSLEEIKSLHTVERQYQPAMDTSQRDKLLRGWHKAVGRSLGWAEPEE